VMPLPKNGVIGNFAPELAANRTLQAVRPPVADTH
jgi:hypothetical protein